MCITLAVILALTVHATAQNATTTVSGVSMPPVSVPPGRQDSGALQEILLFQKTVQAGSWTGMEARGSFTPNATGSSGEAIGAEPATLWILGGNSFRLDSQKSSGTSSLRFDGAYGAIRHEDGRTRKMDARNALAGFLAFPALMEQGFPYAGTSVIDDGITAVDGVPLHRITMGAPWPGGPSAGKTSPPMTVTDLYFDPQTNLLKLSATAAVGSRSEPTRYLRVITYSGYHEINGVMVPGLYSEHLNGQLLWTLDLNNIQLQPGLTDAGFRF